MRRPRQPLWVILALCIMTFLAGIEIVVASDVIIDVDELAGDSAPALSFLS